MASFGKRLASLRKDKKLSQTDLANQLETSVSVISRYERDEMVPSIDAAKKLAGLLDTTVGYLLGETDDYDLFKDPEMLKRFKELRSIGTKEREHILFALDSMLKNIKLKSL
jgi:Predicted transcription factor, homolog of eukaryotic MBF1